MELKHQPNVTILKNNFEYISLKFFYEIEIPVLSRQRSKAWEGTMVKDRFFNRFRQPEKNHRVQVRCHIKTPFQ